jgi:branched-chain amino acid transport system ATP-binding protein
VTAPLLDISGLSVAYGSFVGLRGASLTVAQGEAVALLGANGAGKTTLLRALIGVLPAHAGAIRLDGQPMTVRENLDVACRGGAAGRARRRGEIETMFPQLAEHSARRAWQLSGGQQQMLAIGRALMTAPRLLLLDEPSLGLSPLLTAELLRSIRAISRSGTTILLAEQNVAQALAICDRAYVLETGRIVAAGAAAELAQSPAIRHAFLGAPSAPLKAGADTSKP